MADTYPNFKALAAARRYASDYSLSIKQGRSGIVYFTPHGGGIETGCSELAELSADLVDSYYLFEAKLASGNSVLHITSTNFDEPNARRFIPKHDIAVSYHGYSDSAVKNTKIGGLDTQLRNFIGEEFTANGVPWEQEPEGSNIAGAEPDNIVNVTRRGKGVQLEISTMQRNAFFTTNTGAGRRISTTPEFWTYVNCVKRAVAKHKSTFS